MSEAVVAHVQLETSAYRRTLLLLTIGRLRFVLPLMSFLTCAAIGGGRTSSAVVLGASTVGLALFVWGFVEWQVHSPAAQAVYRPVTYTVREDGIEYETAEERGRIEWDALTRWRVAGTHYVLQARGSRYLLVPVASVVPDDRASFEGLLTRNVRRRSGTRTAGQADGG